MITKIRFLTLLTIIISLLGAPLTGFAQATSTDGFERSDGPLGANWAAHTDLVISSGNLHNSSTGSDVWVLGVYDGTVGSVSDPDEISLTWASEGDGCD